MTTPTATDPARSTATRRGALGVLIAAAASLALPSRRSTAGSTTIPTNTTAAARPTAPDGGPIAAIGHTHLHVRVLERSVAFYQAIFGLEVTERVRDQFAFLSAGHHHHDLALQAIGRDAPAARGRTPGLYHVAFEATDAADFLRFWQRLRDRKLAHSAVDHGISWALYFDDPDGNGLEIYVDRRAHADGASEWGGRSERISYDAIAERVAVTSRPR